MYDWQRSFIDFCIEQEVLQFGQFRLKSGRRSPYFFNAGNFDDGRSQQKIGELYADLLVAAKLDFDMLFGPAYKGIPLVTATAYALSAKFNRNVKLAFNRKEAKDHGEGGQLVGAPLQGKVVLVDDVITAGTAIRETLALLRPYKQATLVAAIVLIDRQERLADQPLSAIQALQHQHQIQILPALTLSQLVEHLSLLPQFAEYLPAIADYRAQYGAG